MVYYVSVRKMQKSYYKNTKKRRKNTRKKSRKNKYRGGAHKMRGIPHSSRIIVNLEETDYDLAMALSQSQAEEEAKVKAEAEKTGLGLAPIFPPPSAVYNRGIDLYTKRKIHRKNWRNETIPEYWKHEQRVLLIKHLTTMLIALLGRIDSYIKILPILSHNREKLEKFRIIVDNVKTTITQSSIYEDMLAENTIGDVFFEGLLQPTKQRMNDFIADTTQFIPFQNKAIEIATNVINWIDTAYISQKNGDLLSTFVRDYTDNGIWSMFGDEGKTIMKDAEHEMRVNTDWL